MFIYCGDCENGSVRVLDTNDMITEEVDLLQLKSLQAQGYPVKKDFSYDYAHDIFELLESEMSGMFMPIAVPYYTAQKVLAKVISINKRFGVGFDYGSTDDFICELLTYRVDFGLAGIFVRPDGITSLAVNSNGVFTDKLDYEFGTDSLDVKDNWYNFSCGWFLYRIDIGSFGKRLHVSVNNRASIEVASDFE